MTWSTQFFLWQGGQPGPDVLVGERNGPVKGREVSKAQMNLTLLKPSRWLLEVVAFSVMNVRHVHCGKHKQGGSTTKGGGVPAASQALLRVATGRLILSLPSRGFQSGGRELTPTGVSRSKKRSPFVGIRKATYKEGRLS